MQSKKQREKAEHARQARLQKKEAARDAGICTWDGAINHVASDDESDSDYCDSDVGSAAGDTSDDEDFAEILPEGRSELMQSQAHDELPNLQKKTAWEILNRNSMDLLEKQWKKAEANRGFGYTGNSERRKREIRLALERKEEADSVIRQG